MKIQNNKSKYTCGTKFHLFGIPSIVIGNGVVMSYYPVSTQDNWQRCWEETRKFITTNQGWYIPSKDELQPYVEFLLANMPHLRNNWIWTQTHDTTKAWNYDLTNESFFYDDIFSRHRHGCMVVFYKLW